MFKKLLSIFLVFPLLGTSSFLKTSNAESTSSVCEKKNKCGNTEDLICTITDAQKRLQQIGGYINFNGVGKNCEYDGSLWDYNSVGDLPMIIGKNLETAKMNIAINEFARFVEDKSITSDNFNTSLSNYLKSDPRFANISVNQLLTFLLEKYGNEKKFKKLGRFGAGAFGLWLGGIAMMHFPFLGIPYALINVALGGFGISFVGGKLYSLRNSKNRQAEVEQNMAKIRNYILAAKSFLNHINNGDWPTADSVLLQVNSDEKSAEGGIVTLLKSKLDYTEEEKQKFNDRFKMVKANLEQIIDRHKAEKWD